MPDIMMDILGSMLPAHECVTKEYVQARIAEAMNTAGSGGGPAVLGPKSISANGVYTASSDGLDGYDQVTVNVPAGVVWSEIANYTASSDVSEIVCSGDFGSYDVYEVTFNGKASAAEWIYPIFSSAGTKGDYVYISTNGNSQFTDVKMRICKLITGNGVKYGVSLHHTTQDYPQSAGDVFNYLKIVPYYNTSVWKAGFNVTIRAANFSS